MKKIVLLLDIVCLFAACEMKQQVSRSDQFTASAMTNGNSVHITMDIHCSPVSVGQNSLVPKGKLRVEYATNSDMTDATSHDYHSNVVFDGTYNQSISLPAGTYYYRAVAEAPYSTPLTTEVASFTIFGYELPSFSEVAVFSEVTSTQVDVNFRILSAGEAKITGYGVCYNTTGMPTIDDPNAIYNGSPSSFSETLTIHCNWLQPGTKYYFRAIALTDKGNSYSNVWVLTTPNN